MDEHSNTSPTDLAGNLIEIHVIPREPLALGMLLMLIGLGLGIFFCVTGIVALGEDSVAPFVCAAIITPFLVLMAAQAIGTEYLKTRLEAAIADHRHTDVGLLLETILSKSNLAPAETRMEVAARSLAAAGHVGLTLRDCPPGDRFDVPPIAVAFEPRPLDQTDAAFAALQGYVSSDALRVETARVPSPQTDGPSPPRRMLLVRGNTNARDIVLSMLMVSVPLSLMDIFENQLRPVAPRIVFAVLVLLALGAWAHLAGLLASQPSLVVPGGLIVRKAPFRRSSWRTCLFDRRTSVLIVHRSSAKRWVAFAANAEHAERVALTPLEAEFLLRAWLSPISPPAPTQLADLT
ncbi:MAG: hypothetical protein PVI86_18340 [Phycisphaerae bacterium]|jgi:hypothetical protein